MQNATIPDGIAGTCSAHALARTHVRLQKVDHPRQTRHHLALEHFDIPQDGTRAPSSKGAEPCLFTSHCWSQWMRPAKNCPKIMSN
jgi:hypothetical protein